MSQNISLEVPDDLYTAIAQAAQMGQTTPGAWIVETSNRQLAAPRERKASTGPAPAGGRALVEAGQPSREAGERREETSDTGESVAADTGRAYTVREMARAWEAIGRPIAEHEAALSVDPDDYPLF